jgi:WHG domain-containing protein
VAHTDDPVADLAAGGAAYFANGLAHPAMYRAMFVDRPPDGGDDPGSAVFVRLVEAVRRCIDAGRFQPAEPTTSLAWAAELWAMRHGVVTLALSDLLPPGAGLVPARRRDLSPRRRLRRRPGLRRRLRRARASLVRRTRSTRQRLTDVNRR